MQPTPLDHDSQCVSDITLCLIWVIFFNDRNNFFDFLNEHFAVKSNKFN